MSTKPAAAQTGETVKSAVPTEPYSDPPHSFIKDYVRLHGTVAPLIWLPVRREIRMEHRAIWRGHLRLALVSCPVALFTSHHEAGNLHFRLINPKTGNRVRMVTHDAETDKELSRSDLVKGFEYKKDHYLLLEDEDFARARIDSSSVLKIEKFVALDTIDPIFFDASYYLAPDGEAGIDVYLVLRDAIAKSGMMGLSRVVMAQRERVVGLVASGDGLVAYTLHEVRDLVPASEIFTGLPKHSSDPEMVKLATQLIARQTAKFNPADWEDRYEARLREVIEAKMEGTAFTPEEEPEDDNVIDLMTALRRSLGKGSSKKAQTTKSKTPKHAPIRTAARKIVGRKTAARK